ncbi:MAG: extracellular solute-binding protein [Clostridiales bacterium]|nr:extracellular solute-binding protein [Clostridiales bacterium]
MDGKRFLRRLISACLILCFIVSACGCRARSKTDSGNGNSGSAPFRREIPADEPYYEGGLTELTIPTDESKTVAYKGVSSVSICGDYIVASYYIDYLLPEGFVSPTGIYSADPTPYEERGLAFFDLDGNFISKKNDSGSPFELMADADGRLVRVKSDWVWQKQAYEMSIIREAPDGSSSETTELSFPADVDPEKFLECSLLEDGTLLLFSTESNQISVFGPDGKYRGDIKFNETGKYLNYNCFQANGKTYLYSVGYDYVTFSLSDPVRYELDLENLSLKEDGICKNLDITSIENALRGKDGMYYYTGFYSDGLFKYDPASDEKSQVLLWNDTDLNRSIRFDHWVCRSENEYIGVASSFRGHIYMAKLKKATANPHAGQKVIRIGCFGISEELADYVCMYNSDHTHPAKIDLVDYNSRLEIVLDTKLGAVTKSDDLENLIYLDILSHEGPDILVNFATYNHFCNDAVMVDLNPYIDGASGIDRSLYFDNIFRAGEVEGKLYNIPLTFSISGLAVNTDYIPEGTDWSFDGVSKLSASLPSDVSLFQNLQYETLLSNIMSTDLTSFINYKDKKVDFQNDTFYSMLDFSSRYGVTAELADTLSTFMISENSVIYDYSDDPTVISPESKFESGILATLNCSVFNIARYSQVHSLIPGKTEFLGYPSKSGDVLPMKPSFSMGITASSEYKEEAWDIIKFFLGEEAQRKLGEGGDLTVMTSAFLGTSDACIEENNFKYLAERRQMGTAREPNEYQYWEISKDCIPELEKLIRRVNAMYTYDEALSNVIVDEVGAFFSGQRSAEETAKLIENRAKNIVQER